MPLRSAPSISPPAGGVLAGEVERAGGSGERVRVAGPRGQALGAVRAPPRDCRSRSSGPRGRELELRAEGADALEPALRPAATASRSSAPGRAGEAVEHRRDGSAVAVQHQKRSGTLITALGGAEARERDV